MPKAFAKNALAQFMNSKLMHFFIGLAVLTNAVVLGWMTMVEKTSATYELLHQIDIVILWIFIVEVTLRILANGIHFFRSGWNWFDFIVVFGGLIHFVNPANSEIFRALRILRLFYFIEISKKLKHILHGLFKAFPGILAVLAVTVTTYYVFAVIGVAMFGGGQTPEFINILKSVETLFQILTMDDWSSLYGRISKVNGHAWIFFYSYFIIMVFVALNLFIGVIVGAMQSAEEDLEEKEDNDKTIAELKALRKEIADLRKAVQK